MTLVVQQDVVQLQVPVDDALAVKEIESQRYLSRVEPKNETVTKYLLITIPRGSPGVFFGQPALALHVEHEIAAPDEFDDEEEPTGRLETGVKPNQEGVIGGGLKYVFFRLHPVDILVVRDQRLLDHL